MPVFLVLVLSCLAAVSDPEECRTTVVAAPYAAHATLAACQAQARATQGLADRLNRNRDPRKGYLRAWCVPARSLENDRG